MVSYVVGNWKMNGDLALLAEMVQKLSSLNQEVTQGVRIVLAPPYPLVAAAVMVCQQAKIPAFIAAQNCHDQESGAYTGEVSPGLLHQLGARYVILGHSERRTLNKETSAVVHAKALAAHAAGLQPIICVGETLEEREQGRAKEVVGKQLLESVPDRLLDGSEAVMIAYEPVWSIGTGIVPTEEQIVSMMDFVREQIKVRKFNGLSPILLYGGSVKSDNIKTIMSLKCVNGVLVGGASLDSSQFLRMIEAAHQREVAL